MFEQMRFGQGFQHTQNLGTFLQCAACQLTDNKRMAKDLLIKEQSFQTFATRSEMLNPNRSVDQNHARLRGRRLRIRRSCFSVPPRFAKRRALSLAIRASSPRRTNEVFSFTPVSLAASCSRESSILSVVLICIKMPNYADGVNKKDNVLVNGGPTRWSMKARRVRPVRSNWS